MAHRLEEHEHAPHRERRDADEAELRGRVARPLRADGEGRHHQHEGRERGERRQRRAGALDPERLLAVAQRAEQHAGADHAVGDDHDGRVHRVARERGLVLAAGEHHRDDQRRLDRGDGQREDERAERLADPVRDDLGVMHGGDDGADQRDAAGGAEQRPERQFQRDAKQRHANQWNECGPVGHRRLPPMSVAHLYYRSPFARHGPMTSRAADLDGTEVKGTEVKETGDGVLLCVVAAYAAAFVAFGLLVDAPADILRGLVAICVSRDTLLTDYFAVGGIGAGCVNAGLLTLCACGVYRVTRAKVTGASVAALFLVLGFGLFGKNLLNIWFIVLGVALYSRFRNEPFTANINTAFFGAALAPIFSEILFSTNLTLEVSLPLGVITSLVIGFVLAPAAAQLFKAHMGFSLYNMGFTAGLVGTLVVALYKSYGFVPDPVMLWSTGKTCCSGGSSRCCSAR